MFGSKCRARSKLGDSGHDKLTCGRSREVENVLLWIRVPRRTRPAVGGLETDSGRGVTRNLSSKAVAGPDKGYAGRI